MTDIKIRNLEFEAEMKVKGLNMDIPDLDLDLLYDDFITGLNKELENIILKNKISMFDIFVKVIGHFVNPIQRTNNKDDKIKIRIYTEKGLFLGKIPVHKWIWKNSK